MESVWDYPRPPRLEPTARHIVVRHGGRLVAETRQSLRVLETSHPPVYYLPPADIDSSVVREATGSSYCEWKGLARYWDVVVGDVRVPSAAWSYPEPTPAFEALRDHLAFYADRLEACLVDGEQVRPQPGSFYGGWITNDLRGPFKGEPGSMGW
ncbi:MAG: DUF427 domain-containing protein [Gemmatimonadetes bacterium]|nr:DUF427 domain-containing protein [Gemmatimonadota bacterium]